MINTTLPNKSVKIDHWRLDHVIGPEGQHASYSSTVTWAILGALIVSGRDDRALDQTSRLLLWVNLHRPAVGSTVGYGTEELPDCEPRVARSATPTVGASFSVSTERRCLLSELSRQQSSSLLSAARPRGGAPRPSGTEGGSKKMAPPRGRAKSQKPQYSSASMRVSTRSVVLASAGFSAPRSGSRLSK